MRFSKKTLHKLIFSFVAIVLFSMTTNAQPYQIRQWVIATGGRQDLSGTSGGGTTYKIEGTIAQSAAGQWMPTGTYNQVGGFWLGSFAPTAGRVTVGGRVMTANGRGIRNVMVTIMDQRGQMRTVLSGPFGYYRFTDIEVGEVYIFMVSSKRFVFNPPSQTRLIIQDTDDINFIAEEY